MVHRPPYITPHDMRTIQSIQCDVRRVYKAHPKERIHSVRVCVCVQSIVKISQHTNITQKPCEYSYLIRQKNPYIIRESANDAFLQLLLKTHINTVQRLSFRQKIKSSSVWTIAQQASARLRPNAKAYIFHHIYIYIQRRLLGQSRQISVETHAFVTFMRCA